MSTKYNYCNQRPFINCQPRNTVTVNCCPPQPTISDQYSAVPESIRIQSDTCNNAQYSTFVTVQSGISIPIIAGAAIPYVDVGATPASSTTSLQRLNVLTATTRFEQYFPPAPLPYVCPIRIPSNEPKASQIPCNPISHFPNSK
jgi:hypothetical protein